MARAASDHPKAKELASLAFEGFTTAVAQADGWANVHSNLSVRFGEPSRAHRAFDLRTVPVCEAVGQGGLHTALGPSPLVPQLFEIRHQLTHAQIDATEAQRERKAKVGQERQRRHASKTHTLFAACQILSYGI